MKIFIGIITMVLLILNVASCTKEEVFEKSECDLHQYTGSWKFIVNGDSSSEYIGQIDKFNDGTLNITYQPSTEFNYFLQAEVNCEDGKIFKQIPAGNHGTNTIEGEITLTNFVYQDSTYINYTGEPQITIKTIEGTKI